MNLARIISIAIIFFCSCELRAQDSFTLFDRNKEPETVEELTRSLINGISDDSLKVLKIYQWITGNITYDYNVYMSGQPIRVQTPDLVYRRRKTTCTGYSNLMVTMLEQAGVKAFTVEGFTQDFVLGLDSTKLSSDHAWVAFNLNGKWQLADPTWDAGDIGLIKTVHQEQVKKSFWKRLKSFRLKTLFRRKKKQQKKKSISRSKVSYRIGFSRKPTMDYIFVDPNEFLKTHLPNTAHIQMKTEPISVIQFCDSAHSLGKRFYTQNGSFNFNAVNDAYYSLEYAERMLWISDSSLNFNNLNHGDKALNAHNYLAHYYGEKIGFRDQLERFISIADTVILHGNLAIKINKQEFKKKRDEFSIAFQQEKKANLVQTTTVNFIKAHLARSPEVYRKGRERMIQKELVSLANWKKISDRKYGDLTLNKGTLPSTMLPDLRISLQNITVLKDSISNFQHLERLEGANYLNHLDELYYAARMAFYADAMIMFDGIFLNEMKLHQKDYQLIDTLEQLNNFMRDSINAFLSNRKSYSYLLKLDQEIKKMGSYLVGMEKKDTSFSAKPYQYYSQELFIEALDEEQALILDRLERSTAIETELRQHFNAAFRELGLDMKDLSYFRTMRQAYLTKMMNNKFNRSIKVYTIILNNAKKWKSVYKANLRLLDSSI